MTIRDCLTDALVSVHAASFPDEPWDAASFVRLLAQPGVFALAEGERGIVLGRVAADESEILTLAVVPENRREGIGSALLAAAKRRALREGARAMYLEVAETNVAALALYERSGFRPVGRRDRYYADGGSALVLAAALTPAPCEAGDG